MSLEETPGKGFNQTRNERIASIVNDKEATAGASCRVRAARSRVAVVCGKHALILL